MKIKFLLSFLITFSLHGMSNEVFQFVSDYADYCYRQGVDFDDSYRGDDDRFQLCSKGYETKFIDHDQLAQLYEKDRAEELYHRYTNLSMVDLIAPEFENKKPSEVVKGFHSYHKRSLLGQLQSYGPSKTTLWLGIGLSCLGLATIGLSTKVADLLKSYTLKRVAKIGMPLGGVIVGLCGLKNINVYREMRGRWKLFFPNFQNLIRICKQQ